MLDMQNKAKLSSSSNLLFSSALIVHYVSIVDSMQA